MYTVLNTNYWNLLTHPKETRCQAEEGDILLFLQGYFFLIQRRNDFNNVIMERYETTAVRHCLHDAFVELLAYLRENKIQYIRIESLKRGRYDILEKIFADEPTSKPALADEDGRAVWYFKTYEEN